MKRPLWVGAMLMASGGFLCSQMIGFLPPAQAQTGGGTSGCPAGTIRGRNLVVNGDFSTLVGAGTVAQPIPGAQITQVNPAAAFTSSLPYIGDGKYPGDPIGAGLSIQTGPIEPGQAPQPGDPDALPYAAEIRGQPFPGDPRNGTPASETYLYSNPGEASFPNPLIWRQTLTGLGPNTTYNFLAYFYNLLTPNAPGAPPVITLRIIDPATGQALPGLENQVINQRQVWIPEQISFKTGPNQTQAVLEIIDTANTVVGDDFGLTAIGLTQCISNIGVAKSAGTPVNNGDGTFTVPYTVTVKNYGEDPITNVQLVENLVPTFANATDFTVSNVQSPTLVVDPNFNGKTNINLLQPNTNTLAGGASNTVTFDVRITPGTGPQGFGPFLNTVTATGKSGNEDVSDTSNDGVEPDPDGDGNPNEPDNNQPTPVILPPVPPPPPPPPGTARLRLVKRITGVTRNGLPLSGISNLDTFVDDPNDPNDDQSNWTQLLPVGLPRVESATPLQSGDQVEYTVYFLSDGTAPVNNARVCDPIPASTAFVSDSFGAGAGILLNQAGVQTPQTNQEDGDRGRFFSPLAPLDAVTPPCPQSVAPNGATLVNLGDVPNTAPNNVGFVRFRVRIE
jgi:uncharacterized repeat protein (TIGR01451 family)